MKVKLVVLLILVMVLVGCKNPQKEEEKGKKEISIEKLVKIKGKYYNLDELTGYTGEVVQYDEGTGLIVGKLSLKEGLLHGEIVNYNKEGGINYLQTYKEGKVDGMTKGYHANGNLRYEREYKDGNMEGIYRTYFENGQIQYEENYLNNLVDGESLIYNIDGELLETNIYEKGKLIEKKIQVKIGEDDKKGAEDVTYTSKIENGNIILEKNSE